MAIRKVRVYDTATGLYTEADVGSISNLILMSDDNTKTLDSKLGEIDTAFTGTNGTAAGTQGMVPAPATTDTDKFLKSDGTWGDPAGGVTSVNTKTGAVVLDADDVGAIDATLKGAVNGVAELDSTGKVPSTQLPSYVDDVIEGYYNPTDHKFYSSKTEGYNIVTPEGDEDPHALGWYEIVDTEYVLTEDTSVEAGKDYYTFDTTYSGEIVGETGKIYVDKDTNKTYRWSGTAYVVISETLALGETSSTAYRGDRGKAAYDHATDSGAISSATAEGLFKIGATAEGHVSSLTAVQKSDITGLGIPAQDTTYTFSDTSVDVVSAYTDGTLPSFTISGDVLTINPGALPVLTTASQTVVTGATAS